MTSPAARTRCPAMPPGWTTDASASRAGECTGIHCAALPARSGAQGGKGPVCEDGGFWPPGQ
jgi:hypothetical protein